MTKTTEQLNYIYFYKGMSILTFNDTDITIPQYIFRATKRYRFNTINGILEKQCVSCNKWFPVCSIKGNEFKFSDNESKFHFFGKSGFHTYCRKCEKPRTQAAPVPTPTGKKQYVNIIIPEHLKQYLKARSILENTTSTNIIIKMLETAATENPINISFK